MNSLDLKTTLVIVIPTSFVASIVINLLDDQFSWPASNGIGIVAGVATGLIAYGIYRLVRKS